MDITPNDVPIVKEEFSEEIQLIIDECLMGIAEKYHGDALSNPDHTGFEMPIAIFIASLLACRRVYKIDPEVPVSEMSLKSLRKQYREAAWRQRMFYSTPLIQNGMYVLPYSDGKLGRCVESTEALEMEIIDVDAFLIIDPKTKLFKLITNIPDEQGVYIPDWEDEGLVLEMEDVILKRFLTYCSNDSVRSVADALGSEFPELKYIKDMYGYMNKFGFKPPMLTSGSKRYVITPVIDSK